MLLSAGASIRLRCPLIPGINDDAEHLQAIAALSVAHPALDGIDILPWHTMGSAKYESLGRPQAPELPAANTGNERIAAYRRILEEAGATGVHINGTGGRAPIPPTRH